MKSEGDSSSIQSTESDPAWAYNNLEEDDSVTCLFCNNVSRGGIDQAKQHQIGGYRNVKACTFCPQDVRDELKAFTLKQKSNKSVVDGYHDLNFDHCGFGENEDGDDDVMKIPSLGNKRRGVHIGQQDKRMKSNVKGPTDLCTTRSNGKSTKQTSMNDACDKDLQARTMQAIASFFYQAGIAFDVARLDSFKEMLELIGNCGPNLRPPSYQELRGPLLKKEVDNVNQWIEGHKKEWSKYGCSIISDGWTDREQRTVINILVNSSKGSVFMESTDASSKSGVQICAILDSFVEEIGEANVVQVITDCKRKSVLAGKCLMSIRSNLFWTPCAAHCIDLMLEDIGNIAKVETTIKRGIFLVGYIYNNDGVLNMMREFTKNKELRRNGITRLTTTYLTLQCLRKQKMCLRNIFTSEKWTESIWAKETKGKMANKIVFMPSFWNNVLWTLKAMAPLVRELRIVKNEKKPAMGYIYKAMDRAKEAIQSAFDKDADHKIVCDIIDKRWKCQLHHPLHLAGYYFNPEFYCTNPSIEKDGEVMKGLLECITTLVPSHAKQDLIMTELLKWVNQEGQFSDDLAIRARGKIAPADWWKLYGKEIPNVQELAIKVLSLACSSSSCERKLSAFEHKMNQLEHKKMQDLVFVKHNLTLKTCHNKDVVYDPISLEDIDYGNEWLIGKMEEKHVLENEDLTRVDAANADGDEEDFDPHGEDMEDEFETHHSNELENEDLDCFDNGDDDGGDYF